MSAGWIRRPSPRVLAAAASVAAVHALAARARPFGLISDEAYHARLALALARGAFALPGPFGGPVTDPLPGYPLLLAAPAAALAPHWGALRALGLAATLAAALLSWRLARRLLPEARAGAVGLLVALSPALVALSGAVLPDAAYAALCAAGFLALDADAPARSLAVLGALAALVRPHGALLALALALGLALRRGARAGLALAAVSLAPLSAWLVRDRLVAGTATDYAAHWAAQGPGGAAAWAAQARDAAAEILGRGAAGAAGWPAPAAAAAGLVLLAFAARGAIRLVRGPARATAAALAFFAAATLAAHLGWRFATARYAVPLLAPLWILAAAGLDGLARPARAAAGLGAALLAAAALAADAALAAAPAPPRAAAYARAADWIRASLPPDARLESLVCQPLALLSGRDVECANPREPREAWIAHLLEARIGWVHEPAGWRPDGYFPPELARFVAARARWLRDPADFERVFADPEDGDVYRLRAGDAGRRLAAWRAFSAADEALRRRDAAALRARLEETVRLEPRFASAWAMLAVLEKDPRRSAALMRRAAEADPGSADVAAELAAREAAARAAR